MAPHRDKRPFHHHYRSPWKRGALSLLLIASVMFLGTLGLHWIEHMPLLDAFYFMSMIATAQGTSTIPSSALGKIFVAIIAFISVGAGTAALAFLFGPFFSQLWKTSAQALEEEEKRLLKK